MIKTISCFIALFLFFQITHAQVEIRQGKMIVCDVGKNASQMDDASGQTSGKQKSGSALRTESFNSVFEVKYSGFPADAKAAVQKAIDIWATTLKSNVKIRLFANWVVNTGSPNNLAYVVPTEVKNFTGAPLKDVWFPVTLAEKLSRMDINSTGEADIVATFNSGRTDWYFGTDGNCPSDKFDLVTIALHELGHGLGFSGTFFANNTIGSYGANGTSQPKIYDTYVQNGTTLLTSFQNGSAALRDQIISNSLTFRSPLARLLNSGSSNPRLYAPNPYDPGSSISHLDEATYPKGTINSLLTPFADFGEVRQNPGPLLKGMFYEMGWLNTFLDHTDMTDKESMTSVSFDLYVTSDTTLNATSGKLFYSFDGFTTSNNVPLAFSSGDKWIATIPSPQVEKTISYYFTFNDVFNRSYRYPLDPAKVVEFYYGVDTKAPVIAAQVVTEIVEFQKIIPITAVVTDNIGIQKVELEYQVNTGVVKKITLANPNGNTYTGQIDLTLENITGGDVIKYRIIATDNSTQANVGTFPAAGFNSINVKLFSTRITFTTDFSADNKEFYGDFSISTPIGFINGALHSSHPYAKSASPTPVNFSTLLLYPIKIKSTDSFLYFDEVVLVEPVNDYVIVEGSKDNGVTWLPMTTAYSAQKNSDWLAYYNSDIQGGDSKAIGTLNYYRSSKIDMLATFAPNDIIFIRFRLSSNNSVNAWGWAIDNLGVQDQITAVNEPVQPSLEPGIVLYPNPVSNKLNFNSTMNLVSVGVYTVTGQLMDIPMDGSTLEMGSLPQGMYLVRMTFADGTIQSKKIIKK